VDAYERIVSARRRGIYESNYLKANSPDGRRAIWVKHNALVPIEGAGLGEFWIVLFERGQTPIVAKREVPWTEVEADPDAIGLRAGAVSLRPERAEGRIADVSWELGLSGGLPPLFDLPYAAMYSGSFPKKKTLTPAPNLRFDGQVRVGGERWDVDGWVGLRGHNWGTEHAHSYAYGTCNTWDDGAGDRAVVGFTARIRLGRGLSPWLTGVVGTGPDIERNRLRHWLGAGSVAPERWSARWRGPRRRQAELVMTTDPSGYAGLRYAHPDGRESYCYNTKFADVSWTVDDRRYTSRCGELEVLFPEPLPGIDLHPAPGWTAADGDYRSA
jgi:hypothetical protein